MRLKHISTFSILLISIIIVSGCTTQNNNHIQSQEKTLDIILEETLNAEVPDYTKYIDVTSLRKNDNLTIEYIAYTAGFAPNIYEHMTKVFAFLDNYLKESGESYDSIKLIAIGWQTGDQYTIELTREELSNFVLGEFGFEQWQEMVSVVEG